MVVTTGHERQQRAAVLVRDPVRIADRPLPFPGKRLPPWEHRIGNEIKARSVEGRNCLDVQLSRACQDPPSLQHPRAPIASSR